MKAIIIVTLFILALAATVQAQGWIVTEPGKSPTFVNPNGSGGYVVQTPGRIPTFVNPNGSGGYVVQTPGQTPIFINPNGVNPYPRPQTYRQW